MSEVLDIARIWDKRRIDLYDYSRDESKPKEKRSKAYRLNVDMCARIAFLAFATKKH